MLQLRLHLNQSKIILVNIRLFHASLNQTICTFLSVLSNETIDDSVARAILPSGGTGAHGLSAADIDETTFLKNLKDVIASELRTALEDEIDDIQDDLTNLHQQVDENTQDLVRNQIAITAQDLVTH